jgi:hypothetical protein
MPAFTSNRNYPYSLQTDPADIPQAIEDLARAVDLDIDALSSAVAPRPFAKVSSKSTVKQQFPAGMITELTFDFLDYDNAGISDLSTRPTRLTPTSPGVWMVWASIELPAFLAASYDFLVRVNGTDIGRSNTHLGRIQTITLASMSFMDGVDDYFTATFQPVPGGGGGEDARIGNKSMACFKLTSM